MLMPATLPRIALAQDGDAEPLDLTLEEARAAVERYPEIRREWSKWNARFPGGRLIVVDPSWVARLMSEIVAPNRREPGLEGPLPQ